MLSEHSHIDMLNATGTKKAKARCLGSSYVYLDTFSTFHQNINPDTVNNIHTVWCGLKSHSNGGVIRINQKANYRESLGGLKPGSRHRVWQTSSPSINMKRSTPSHMPMN